MELVIKYFLIFKSRFPVVLVLFVQLLVFLVQLLIWKNLISYPPQAIWILFVQITVSTIISQIFLKLPNWFFYISIFFPFLIFISINYFHFSYHIFGILFLILFFTFSHTLKERVPLYLTNSLTCEALVKISQEKKIYNFVDLGSGLGNVVRSLARNQIRSVGVETAPFLWVCSYLCSKLFSLGEVRKINIWETDLSEFDYVYAFLAPSVMTKLYNKAQKEMKSSSYLVSNSFQIEGVNPDEIWELSDSRKTKLYLYQIR